MGEMTLRETPLSRGTERVRGQRPRVSRPVTGSRVAPVSEALCLGPRAAVCAVGGPCVPDPAVTRLPRCDSVRLWFGAQDGLSSRPGPTVLVAEGLVIGSSCAHGRRSEGSGLATVAVGSAVTSQRGRVQGALRRVRRVLWWMTWNAR